MNFIGHGFQKLEHYKDSKEQTDMRPNALITSAHLPVSSASAEIARVGGRYAVQGHSRSLIHSGTNGKPV